jgi:2-hydroxychromene-2-carboxylate isomerase
MVWHDPDPQWMITMKTIDYYYSTRSNFTLLGAARLNTLARAFNRKIIHRPILLSVTMKPLGAIPFDERPAILRNYAMRDALRTAAHLGIPLLREPVHHMGAGGAAVRHCHSRAERGEPWRGWRCGYSEPEGA